MDGKCNFCTVLLYIWSLDQEFVIYALYLLLRHVGYSFMFGLNSRKKFKETDA